MQVPSRDAALYVHPLVGRLSVDGYDSDWQAMRPFAQAITASGNAQKLTVMLAGRCAAGQIDLDHVVDLHTRIVMATLREFQRSNDRDPQ